MTLFGMNAATSNVVVMNRIQSVWKLTLVIKWPHAPSLITKEPVPATLDGVEMEGFNVRVSYHFFITTSRQFKKIYTASAQYFIFSELLE